MGSAGPLRDASYGAEIDGHEAVFRMNDAPTVGYEKVATLTSTLIIPNLTLTRCQGGWDENHVSCAQ